MSFLTLQTKIIYLIKKILDHKMKYSLQSERRKGRQLNASLIHPTTFHISLPKLRKYAQHAAAVVRHSSTSQVLHECVPFTCWHQAQHFPDTFQSTFLVAHQ